MLVRRARPDELATCHAIRHAVFVVGQGVPVDLEVDGLDESCEHVLAFDGDLPVGTARLRQVDGHGKAERVAVLESHRGLGVGVMLMQAIETIAAEHDHDVVHLHAQWQVVPFYQRLGYGGVGEPFDEAGIRHLAMTRRLR